MVSHTVLQQPHFFTVADDFSSVTLWKLLSVVILQFGDYGYQWAACQPSLLLKHAILSSYILKRSPDKMLKPLAMSCLPKAPQLSLNSLPNVVGGGKAKHGQTSLQTSKTGLIQRETCLCLKIISVQSRLSAELPLAHRAVYVSSAVTEANCTLLKRISCHL